MDDRMGRYVTCKIKDEFYEMYKDVVDSTSLCSIGKAAIILLAMAGVKPEKRRKKPRRDPDYYISLLLEAAKRLEESRSG